MGIYSLSPVGVWCYLQDLGANVRTHGFSSRRLLGRRAGAQMAVILFINEKITRVHDVLPDTQRA